MNTKERISRLKEVERSSFREGRFFRTFKTINDVDNQNQGEKIKEISLGLLVILR